MGRFDLGICLLILHCSDYPLLKEGTCHCEQCAPDVNHSERRTSGWMRKHESVTAEGNNMTGESSSVIDELC